MWIEINHAMNSFQRIKLKSFLINQYSRETKICQVILFQSCFSKSVKLELRRLYDLHSLSSHSGVFFLLVVVARLHNCKFIKFIIEIIKYVNIKLYV